MLCWPYSRGILRVHAPTVKHTLLKHWSYNAPGGRNKLLTAPVWPPTQFRKRAASAYVVVLDRTSVRPAYPRRGGVRKKTFICIFTCTFYLYIPSTFTFTVSFINYTLYIYICLCPYPLPIPCTFVCTLTLHFHY